MKSRFLNYFISTIIASVPIVHARLFGYDVNKCLRKTRINKTDVLLPIEKLILIANYLFAAYILYSNLASKLY